MKLFDRSVGLIPKLAPRELERGMRLLGEVSDETVLRLVHLLGSLPDDDVLELIEALSRLSPTATYAVPAGPRRPTRRGSDTRSTMPHASASVSARLAARWDRPSASRISRSVRGTFRTIR